MVILQGLTVQVIAPCQVNNIDTAAHHALLFEDYLTYREGQKELIFAHQIVEKCCNLSNDKWNILTCNVSDIDCE